MKIKELRHLNSTFKSLPYFHQLTRCDVQEERLILPLVRTIAEPTAAAGKSHGGGHIPYKRTCLQLRPETCEPACGDAESVSAGITAPKSEDNVSKGGNPINGLSTPVQGQGGKRPLLLPCC